MKLFVTNEEYSKIRKLGDSCYEFKPPNLMDINAEISNEPTFNENKWLAGLMDMVGEIPTDAVYEDNQVVVVPKVEQRWAQ